MPTPPIPFSVSERDGEPPTRAATSARARGVGRIVSDGIRSPRIIGARDSPASPFPPSPPPPPPPVSSFLRGSCAQGRDREYTTRNTTIVPPPPFPASLSFARETDKRPYRELNRARRAIPLASLPRFRAPRPVARGLTRSDRLLGDFDRAAGPESVGFDKRPGGRGAREGRGRDIDWPRALTRASMCPTSVGDPQSMPFETL